MIIFLTETWNYFLICLGLLLITNVIMGIQSRQFFTMGVTKKPFSIFDLEFPASASALYHLLNGINQLPYDGGRVVKKALRGQLYVDFLFMPGVYLAIFLLCMKTATKIPRGGGYVFAALAYLQLLAWVCDVVENIFLLIRLKNPALPSAGVFLVYQIMEFVKWGSSCLGFFLSVFVLLFFWLTGNYEPKSTCYIFWMGLEIAVFVFLVKKTKKVKLYA